MNSRILYALASLSLLGFGWMVAVFAQPGSQPVPALVAGVLATLTVRLTAAAAIDDLTERAEKRQAVR